MKMQMKFHCSKISVQLQSSSHWKGQGTMLVLFQEVVPWFLLDWGSIIIFSQKPWHPLPAAMTTVMRVPLLQAHPQPLAGGSAMFDGKHTVHHILHFGRRGDAPCKGGAWWHLLCFLGFCLCHCINDCVLHLLPLCCHCLHDDLLGNVVEGPPPKRFLSIDCHSGWTSANDAGHMASVCPGFGKWFGEWKPFCHASLSRCGQGGWCFLAWLTTGGWFLRNGKKVCWVPLKQRPAWPAEEIIMVQHINNFNEHAFLSMCWWMVWRSWGNRWSWGPGTQVLAFSDLTTFETCNLFCRVVQCCLETVMHLWHPGMPLGELDFWLRWHSWQVKHLGWQLEFCPRVKQSWLRAAKHGINALGQAIGLLNLSFNGSPCNLPSGPKAKNWWSAQAKMCSSGMEGHNAPGHLVCSDEENQHGLMSQVAPDHCHKIPQLEQLAFTIVLLSLHLGWLAPWGDSKDAVIRQQEESAAGDELKRTMNSSIDSFPRLFFLQSLWPTDLGLRQPRRSSL